MVIPTTIVNNNYILYPKTNVHSFLKLDKCNGKILQDQYSMDENEFTAELNRKELGTKGKSEQFELYSTTNLWTFILLDSINGDTYLIPGS